jgi:hypothetical protein
MANQETVFNQGLNPLALDLLQIVGPGAGVVWRLRQNFAVWFTGLGAPTTQAGQLNGNLYFDTTTGDIWQLQSGTWIVQSLSGSLPGGSNTQVQFNDTSTFNGDAGLTYIKGTQTLNVGAILNAPVVNAATQVNTPLVQSSGNVAINSTSGQVAIVADTSGTGPVFILTGTTGFAVNVANGDGVLNITENNLIFSTTVSGGIFQLGYTSGSNGRLSFGLDTGILQVNHFEAVSDLNFDIGNNNTVHGSRIACASDGTLTLVNNAGTSFSSLTFGGTTASFPSLVVSGTILSTKLADGSAFSEFQCSKLTFPGSSSGQASISVNAAAGTPNPMLMPTSTGTAGQVLTTDGGNPQNLSWSQIPGQLIASGTQALGTTLIASGAAAATIDVTATGVLATDNVLADFNSDPTSTVGYEPSANGMLTIIKYPSAGFVHFIVVNNTGASITPGSVTLNWRAVR